MAHGDVTELLRAYRDGDQRALDDLLPIVYDDLQRIAKAHVRRGPAAHTLHTMTLVHEAYLRLVDQTRASYEDRGHFLAVCARAMRQIVISNARRNSAEKRGGATPPKTWDDNLAPDRERAELLVDLDTALQRLGERDPRLAHVVECRFFGGYSVEETAEALGVTTRTVHRDWVRARAWLREDLDLDALG